MADLFEDWALRGCASIEYAGERRPLVGGIALVRRLGRGGMGVVFHGVNPRLDTKVAVKVLARDVEKEDPAAVDRFVQEVRLAAKLEPPHLSPVLDVGHDDALDTHYIVMEFEFVKGLSAQALLDGEMRPVYLTDKQRTCPGRVKSRWPDRGSSRARGRRTAGASTRQPCAA